MFVLLGLVGVVILRVLILRLDGFFSITGFIPCLSLDWL